jgi:hypothetical protein
MGAEHTGAHGRRRLNQLRRRIEGWRGTRAKRSPMPAELWIGAMELARELGVSRVARELRIGYGSLKERLGGDGERGPQAAQRFVEIDGGSLFPTAAASGRGEVELADASGMTVVIRLAAGQAVDVAALLAAFRRGPA